MGFGTPLDLSSILPSYVKHLTEHHGTAGINFIDTGHAPAEADLEPIPRALYRPRQTLSDDPLKVGNGPAACSTNTDLVLDRPAFAWDTNHYYRNLGIPFPYVNATPGALAKGYLAVGGSRSARATYCLKQLLDRSVRRRYDTVSLGELFMEDELVQENLKRDAQIEASRRSQEGKYTDAEEILDEWGYLLKDDAEGVIDTDGLSVQDGVLPREDSFEPIEWTYSYWLWTSPGSGSITYLERWQRLLISELSSRGVKVNLAVGLMGKQPHDYAVGEFDGYRVVFLNDTKVPTQQIAAKAADALLDTGNRIPPVIHTLKKDLT